MPVDPVPEQYGSVTPSLTVSPCAEAIEFYARAFAAVENIQRAGLDPGFAKPWAECVIGMVRAAGTSWLESRSMPRAQLVEYLTTILWDGFSSLRHAAAEK